MIKEAFVDFKQPRNDIKLFGEDFMPFRTIVKFLWQFVGKIHGGVAENV